LEAGVTYLIQITARMGSAEEPRPSETVMVTMLSAADREQVRQFETQVEALGLSAESARFFLAAYYADQKLYDAAIAELVSLAKQTPSPLTYWLLGDVYLAVVLDGKAAQSYERARRLAQAQDNRLVQAEAEVGLGHVAYAAKKFEQALSHYQAALALYQELGLESDAEAVAKLVADTKAQLPTPTP
jgi:tetratricopeptide (TPR) repeat protein